MTELAAFLELFPITGESKRHYQDLDDVDKAREFAEGVREQFDDTQLNVHQQGVRVYLMPIKQEKTDA